MTSGSRHPQEENMAEEWITKASNEIWNGGKLLTHNQIDEIIERHYRAAQAPGETCPTPAPQKDGSIHPHCMGTEFPKK